MIAVLSTLPVGEKYMLILSCQREILPMLSIGQIDVSMSIGEEHYATNALFAFPLSGLAEEISIELNNQSLCLTVC